MTKHNQQGWGLTETMLSIGAVSVMALAIYVALGPTSATAQTKREQDNLRHLSTAVDHSWGLLGSFDGVSTARVLDDGLAPSRMRDGDSLRTAWGTRVGIHPHTVAAPPGTHNAFLVSYPLAPTEVCARLASAMSREAFDIRVESRSVYVGGQLDPTIAAEQCGSSDAASMEFVFHSGLVSGQAVAAAPVVLPPPPPTIAPPPGVPPIITIPGTPTVNPVNPGTPAVPPPAAPPPVLPPPVAPPGTPPAITPPTTFIPPPPPVTPPGTMCTPRTDSLGPETRNQSCPAGQLGTITQQRAGTLAWTCPEAWGTPVRGSEVWGSWTETGRTCAPACSAPAPTTETQTLACPSGQLGAITQQRTTTWTCPAPTGSPTSTTTPWATTVNTCAAACEVPSPSTETRTGTNGESRPATQTQACPPGTIGTQTRSGFEYRDLARTASCPSPTGPVSWTSWTATSGWVARGTWTEWTGICAAACVVPNPATQTDTQSRPATQSQACPPGTIGTQTRSGYEYRDGTRTASCPSATGPLAWTAWTYTPWEARGTWTEWSNTCEAAPSPINGQIGNWFSGTGYVGDVHGPTCVLSPHVNYQLLVLNVPSDGHRNWYRMHGEAHWTPVPAGNRCALGWFPAPRDYLGPVPTL